MAVVNRYRIWCETESAYAYAWAEVEPTQCPNNSGHSIDTDSIAMLESAGSAQSYTADGAVIMVKQDRAETEGNQIIMKRLDAELAPESNINKDWVIPSGKTWNVRIFSASCIAYEVEAKLEFFRAFVSTTTAPATTTTSPPDAGFERVNLFDNDADEAIAVLKLDGNSDSTPFYESLLFTGDGESFLRVTLENKDSLDSVEATAYFNGYEMSS